VSGAILMVVGGWTKNPQRSKQCERMVTSRAGTLSSSWNERRVCLCAGRWHHVEAGEPELCARGGGAAGGCHRPAGLRDKGQIQPGHKVLIVGASGGVGTFAVQLARAFGADVTGVCSTKNVDLVRSIGADHVIDYTEEDFTRTGRVYDLIFQVAGTRSPSQCRRALTANGTLVLCSGPGAAPVRGERARWLGPVPRTIRALALSRFGQQKMVAWTAKPTKNDLADLKELIEAGNVAPVIDKIYPLSDVPEAIRYLEQGHARGKVVITI
jgi:NADPH:quinone reductase-like Zn-dependent oxidoreductase